MSALKIFFWAQNDKILYILFFSSLRIIVFANKYFSTIHIENYKQTHYHRTSVKKFKISSRAVTNICLKQINIFNSKNIRLPLNHRVYGIPKKWNDVCNMDVMLWCVYQLNNWKVKRGLICQCLDGAWCKDQNVNEEVHLPYYSQTRRSI